MDIPVAENVLGTLGAVCWSVQVWYLRETRLWTDTPFMTDHVSLSSYPKSSLITKDIIQRVFKDLWCCSGRQQESRWEFTTSWRNSISPSEYSHRFLQRLAWWLGPNAYIMERCVLIAMNNVQDCLVNTNYGPGFLNCEMYFRSGSTSAGPRWYWSGLNIRFKRG